jgi:hypothetical protein
MISKNEKREINKFKIIFRAGAESTGQLSHKSTTSALKLNHNCAIALARIKKNLL